MKLKVSILIISVGLLGSLFLDYQVWKVKRPDVLSVQDVNVNATVPFYISVDTKPQKRIPVTGNDFVTLEIEIRPVGNTTPIFQETVSADSDGKAALSPISSMLLAAGNYDVAIKGLSHLRRTISNQTIADNAVQLLDYNGTELLAGDSHPSADNYVNSLDIGYTATQLYLSDLRADLNRDGVVNSLDFSALIGNLYSNGDN